MFSVFKKHPWNIVFLLVAVLFFYGNPICWSAPPQEKILIIYYADTTETCADGVVGAAGDTYPQQLETAFYQAITVIDPAANVQTLAIHAGDSGIYTELESQYGVNNLLGWCQVYDLRFMDECDNQGWEAGYKEPDALTDTGANNDFELYQSYLKSGGSLFLQGEHHDYYSRDNNLLQFVNTVASSPVISTICSTYICADVNPGDPYTFSNFATANYNFNDNYNDLTAAASLTGVWIGGITDGNQGSGEALVTLGGYEEVPGQPDGAMMLGWEGTALQGTYGAGKMVASFETNAFATVTLQNPWTFEVIQNVYTLLSGCEHFTVEKSFNQPSLCVGQGGSFTICATNTGTATLTGYSISDTLPTCLSYVNSSPSTTATAGSSSNLYWWTFPNVSPGASVCVTVQFNVVNNTCP